MINNPMAIDSREEAIECLFKDKIVSMEFANMFIGKLLGSGCSRYVFECAMNKKHVVKVDMSNLNANVSEFQVWSSVMHTRVAKYFAPVRQMSVCGRILIMDKADCNKTLDKYPKEIPSFFADIKQTNFGFIKDQFVCVDYASHMLIEKGMRVDMRKVKWK